MAEAIGLGTDAVPALRNLVFRREPSGLYQPRCRAVEALAALKAFAVLGDFLRLRREIADPIERVGEDAVVSAAGRAIAHWRSPWVCDLLFEAARRRPLPGVLAGLGSFSRRDSIPIFIDALGEDELRPTAQAVLRDFGKAARPALVAAALGSATYRESESGQRRRRSALALLEEIGITRAVWAKLRELPGDPDRRIALLACRLCLAAGGPCERPRLCDRLVDLRKAADWMEPAEIDDLAAAAGCAQALSPRSRIWQG